MRSTARTWPAWSPRMTVPQLHQLRDAFILDRDAGAPPVFCQSRIDAIDAELHRRHDSPAGEPTS